MRSIASPLGESTEKWYSRSPAGRPLARIPPDRRELGAPRATDASPDIAAHPHASRTRREWCTAVGVSVERRSDTFDRARSTGIAGSASRYPARALVSRDGQVVWRVSIP